MNRFPEVDKTESIFIRLDKKWRIIWSVISIAVYFGLFFVVFNYIEKEAYLLIIIPAAVISGFLGRNAGIISVIVLNAITVALQFILNQWQDTFITEVGFALVIVMFAAITIGMLADLHLKLKIEKGKRIEIETDKEKQKKSLKQLESRLRSIFENATIGFYRITPEGSIVMVNPALLNMMNYPFFEIVFQQDMSSKNYPHYAIRDFKQRMEKDGKIIGVESEWERYNGTKIFIHETAWQVKDESGRVIYYDGIISDITEVKEAEKKLRENMKQLENEIAERKKAEKTLKDSEERYRALVEKAGIAITMDDLNGQLIYHNQQLKDMFGYTDSELKRKKITDLVHPDDVEFVRKNHNDRIQGKESPTRYDYRAIRKDGSQLYIEADVVVLKDSENNTIGTRCYMWDITERKKAEISLKESEERFRGILDNATVGFYRTTADGRIVMANQALIRMLGYPSFESLSKRNLESEPEPQYGRLIFKDRIEKEGIIFGFENQWLKADGSTIDIRESAWLIRDEEGNPLFYEGIVENISDRIKAEEKTENIKAKLQKSQTEVKILMSLLPICTSCKKIKDEKGRWVHIQEYIDNHPDQDFSQKICPTCIRKMADSYESKKNGKKDNQENND